MIGAVKKAASGAGPLAAPWQQMLEKMQSGGTQSGQSAASAAEQFTSQMEQMRARCAVAAPPGCVPCRRWPRATPRWPAACGRHAGRNAAGGHDAARGQQERRQARRQEALSGARAEPGAVTRTETNKFGPIEVPAEALWGAQTERSRRFFAIGSQRMPLELVHALAEVKRAAALVNGELGLLDGAKRRRSPPRRPRRGRRNRCRVPALGLADRLGYAKQHERQRGDRQPGVARARWRARQRPSRAPERRRQSRPVVERCLPERDPYRRGVGVPQSLASLANLRSALEAKARVPRGDQGRAHH